MLDEKEFASWVGLSPLDKDLNGKKGKDREIMPIRSVDEEGNWKEFYLVSLEGLELGDVLSMRRTQFQYYVDIILDEHHVPMGNQLSKDQPRNWFEYATKDHFTKHRGFVPKQTFSSSSGDGLKLDRPLVHSLSKLMEKASGIISSREDAEAHAEAPDDDEMDSQDQLADIDAENEGKSIRHAQLPDMMLSNMGGPTPTKPAPKKQARGSHKKRKTDEEEDDAVDLESATGSSLRMLELGKNDPELVVVAQKHENITGRKAPKSFENLRVQDVFVDGNSTGKQNLYGVGPQDSTQLQTTKCTAKYCFPNFILTTKISKLSYSTIQIQVEFNSFLHLDSL